MTQSTLIFTWRDWEATAGLVSIIPLGYTKDGPALVVPRSRVIHVIGTAAVDVTPYAGHVVEIRWTPQGVADPYVQTVIVPASGEVHALDLDRVDPSTLEPLPEDLPSAVDLVARAEALVARIESGEFTGAAGTDGRGIASVTAEGETATVAYTDGTTSTLTLPRGPAGEPGRDGVDGEPGADGRDGRDGQDGRTPALSWQGTALAVDGVPGPDLRGPAGKDGRAGVDGSAGRDGAPGPAPSIKIGSVTSGSTPSATITGTSPDLTLGLVLPKGDAGTTPDTGWRKITPDRTFVTSGFAYFRRIGNVCFFRLGGAAYDAVSLAAITARSIVLPPQGIPDGFRSTSAQVGIVTDDGASIIGTLYLASSSDFNQLQIRGSKATATTYARAACLSYVTDDPWPALLPGTPA